MNGKARVVTICLLVIAAHAAGARPKSRPGKLVIEIRPSTGKDGPAGKAAYSVAGKPLGQARGARPTPLVRRLAIAISLARTRDGDAPSGTVSIVTDADLAYTDLRAALTAAAECGAGNLTLARTDHRRPGKPKAKPAAFKLWTPPRTALGGRLRQADAGQVSINMTTGRSGAPPIVTYSIPGLLKNSASETELWKGLRGLKASLPDGAGLMVLPADSVPSGAVVATVTKATEAGFHKIGFLEVLEPADNADRPPAGDTPADANTDPRPVAKAHPPASQPSSAPAPAATQPARTPVPPAPLADANTVIFIMDRSGSVAPVFEQQVSHLLSLIDQLKPTQAFHLICFSESTLLQAPKLYPLPADDKAKAAATKFLRNTCPSGSTNVLPALMRAETIFRYVNSPKGSKTIVLISDGDFAGISGGSTYKTRDGSVLSGNEAITQWLRDHNKDDLFRLHAVCTNPSEDGTKILKAIAKENGGQYWDIPQPK